MKKIIPLEKIADLITFLKKENEKIVLTGGCFDILHEGHIKFLKNAKAQGTKLIILLEEDYNVKKLKGNNRPIHTQSKRASILSAIKEVDYVILLSGMKNSQDYAKLIDQIKPSVIAITDDDKYRKEKEAQAKNVNAKLISVIKRIDDKSTTKLAKFIKK